jgi:hypothetical protein
MKHSSAISEHESNPGGEDKVRLVDSAGRYVVSEKLRALNEDIHQPLLQYLLLCENSIREFPIIDASLRLGIVRDYWTRR